MAGAPAGEGSTLPWVAILAALARNDGTADSDETVGHGFADAPADVRDLAAGLLRMGGQISDGEQRLRGSITAQASVARELHHRVGNNLQVMASLLSLQARDIPAGPARHALEEAQLRITAMAIANGLLYADVGITHVAMGLLLDPIATIITAHIGIPGTVDLGASLAPRMVDIDRAIPLALWIVEAALCIGERTHSGRRACAFTITMTNEDGVMCLIVSARGLTADQPCSSLHHRLVVAIAQQLGARARIDDVGPSNGKIVLCLPHEALTDRHDAPVSEPCAVLPLHFPE
jgi:two-component sensor histidine kinase